jgi:alpha-tubulin suppressor-like RCC1 family protein
MRVVSAAAGDNHTGCIIEKPAALLSVGTVEELSLSSGGGATVKSGGGGGGGGEKALHRWVCMWGKGDEGMLGVIDPEEDEDADPTDDQLSPMRIEDIWDNSYVPGVGNGIESLSLGSDVSAVVTTDGSLYLWGGGEDGMMVCGDTDRYDPEEDEFMVTDPVDRPCKVRPALFGRGKKTKVSSVSLGGTHGAALTEEGVVYVWGRFDTSSKASAGPQGTDY